MSEPVAATVVDDLPEGRSAGRRLPRLGFLGVGWIGCQRLQAIAASGQAEITAIADGSPEARRRAAEFAPGANSVGGSLEELMEADLDGVVIATPSALHAAQTRDCLERGLAVFCQKPLARSGRETEQVIQTARKANRLLGVDLSYRWLDGPREIRALCQEGELGEIYAADLTFHNAYGPDKAWFYQREFSGGGCVIDLGIHLVDLALWVLGFPAVNRVTSQLFAQGRRIQGDAQAVEDYAVATLELATGAVVRIACSWKISAGCDAVIEGSFFGTRGGALFHNLNGSFFDFAAERFYGRRREALSSGPSDWAGKAAIDWVQRLERSPEFAPDIEWLNPVAQTLDAIYQNA